ncbi:MAG TPA: hypothetical protein VF227_03265, partial [Actinomycetes bacterium]
MRDHIARETTNARVVALLTAAAAPAERPVPGEAEALDAFRLAMCSPADHPRRRMQSRTTAKLAAAAALSALSLVGGGYAVAATGTLPGAAQQVARDALGTVGVTVPGPADQAAEPTATRGSSAEAKAAAEAKQAEATAEATTEANAHGKAVSGLATTTTLTGAEKGAAISELASGGKSRAGEDEASAAATPTPTTTATAIEDEDEDTDDATTGDEASGG